MRLVWESSWWSGSWLQMKKYLASMILAGKWLVSQPAMTQPWLPTNSCPIIKPSLWFSFRLNSVKLKSNGWCLVTLASPRVMFQADMWQVNEGMKQGDQTHVDFHSASLWKTYLATNRETGNWTYCIQDNGIARHRVNTDNIERERKRKVKHQRATFIRQTARRVRRGMWNSALTTNATHWHTLHARHGLNR